MKLVRRAATVALVLLAALPAHALAVKVNVRVEGPHTTLLERNVDTFVHPVTGDSTGPHKCDGTNAGASNTPGPTLTGAFDDAARKAGVSWEGSWNQSFEDFLIDRVGPDRATSTQFWGTVLDFKDTEAGGCQVKVEQGDQVLIAFDSFGKTKLRLSGANGSRSGQPFALFVTDGATGKPVAGARVASRTTNSQGRVLVRKETRGLYRFKARADNAIRSNQWKVRIK
ncbi:MAG: hypothetical protein M3340_16855 [Actinomycetota bacterium]|nr:hypothetical protein [Actinomycetota bacterium]